MNEISIHETENGAVEVRLERDTIWLSQEQMAPLFDVQKSAVSKHLKNIYVTGEREQAATVSKMGTVQREEHFDLHAVISVVYRVNSTRATRCSYWAHQHPARAPDPGLHSKQQAIASHFCALATEPNASSQSTGKS